MQVPAALAPFASMAGASRGRRYPEPESPTRSAFQRDRDRIIHSAAFRRLQYKTQVFVYHEGDHYRTRLTHSLEVSQIARSICRVLGLDSDLAEALALAHDLGHTPFGHAGEEVLDRVMAGHGGFDHNAQTLRILTRLERRYAAFDGLNLTWEALEGTVKHNGPIDRAGPVPAAILDYDAEHDLELGSWPGPEAQVAALADDIAYNYHDLDDGVRAGLFPLAAAAEVPVVNDVLAEVTAAWPHLEMPRLTHEVVRQLIGLTIDDVLAESRRRIAAAAPASVEAVHRLDGALIGFSPAMRDVDRQLKSFLTRHMYRHERVAQRSQLASEVVSGLFEMYTAEPDRMPEEWRSAAGTGATVKARTVADFIAGMTDRFALQEYRRLTGVDADV